jgi:hypothetical protein
MWDTVFKHKDKIDELRDEYLESLPSACARLNDRLAGQVDFELDGTVESLTPLNRWYMGEIIRAAQEPATGLPVWWDPEMPTADDGDPETYPFTRSQLALIDEVQAYYAFVLRNVRPDAPWVTYKGGKVDMNNGSTMLQLGKKKYLSPHTVVYGIALRVVRSHQHVSPDAMEALTREMVIARD